MSGELIAYATSRNWTNKSYFFKNSITGYSSLLGVIAGGLFKGCKREQGGETNKQARRKPNMTKMPTFICLLERKDVNWLDRAADKHKSLQSLEVP